MDNPRFEPRPQLYNGQVLRTTLETEWAFFLDKHEIPYLYERQKLCIGPRVFYLPDCYLPELRM